MHSRSLALSSLVCALAACNGERIPIDPVILDAQPYDPTPLDGGPLPAEGALGLNDVSVLFPLPDRVGSDTQLTLGTEGVGGALLSRDRFDAIDVFADLERNEAIGYEQWRIVAMRVDPCFPDIGNLERDPAQCRRQIRLVAQPLVDGLERTGALDSAIHLMFDLPSESFELVLAELRRLRGARPVDRAEVLGVHPVLSAEGLDGAYGRGLREMILQHAGHARLSQFTFMRGDENFTWRFGGFTNARGVLQALPVHGVVPDAENTGFSQSIGFNFGPTSIHPSTPNSSAIAPLLGRHTGTAPGDSRWEFDGDRARVRAAIVHTLEIEHPRMFHAENVDCASCHLAAPLRIRAERLGHSTSDLHRFQSAWNLALGGDPAMTGAPNRVRAFGYFHGSPVISQRTVNESAAIADAINARR